MLIQNNQGLRDQGGCQKKYGGVQLTFRIRLSSMYSACARGRGRPPCSGCARGLIRQPNSTIHDSSRCGVACSSTQGSACGHFDGSVSQMLFSFFSISFISYFLEIQTDLSKNMNCPLSFYYYFRFDSYSFYC